MPHYDYVELAPGLWQISYTTVDLPPFFAVVVSKAQGESLVGLGSLFYLKDGTPVAILKTRPLS